MLFLLQKMEGQMIQTQWIGGKYPGIMKAVKNRGADTGITEVIKRDLEQWPGSITADIATRLEMDNNLVSNTLSRMRSRLEVKAERIMVSKGPTKGFGTCNRWYLT